MKQLKWIIILAVTAVVLTVVFLFVDKKAEKKEEQAKAGEAKQLFSIDLETVRRIVIDNEEGHFAFDWSMDAGTWRLVSSEQFNLNPYVVTTICNAFCTLRSEKTVAFDCKDTAPYGFEHPVKVQLYTTERTDDPYVLYVGDNTPTYDSFYAMTADSNDVYTLDYQSGATFCVAKNTLKNTFLFDTLTSLVTSYRQEDDGKLVMEIKRDAKNVWQLVNPKTEQELELDRTAAENLIDTIVRENVSAYLEENPKDLAKYGLDHPKTKIKLTGMTADGEKKAMNEEIWFGNNVSDRSDETEMYGYFVSSKQLFKIKRADYSAIHQDLASYLSPFCITVGISDLKQVDVDLGEVYSLKTEMKLDYENEKYWLDNKEIKGEELTDLYRNFYRSVTLLRFSELDLDAKPENNPAMTITYHYNDGTVTTLGFVQFADNNFYLMRNGVYTGMTVRLNRFTSTNSITKNYETLIKAMK